MQSGIPLLYKNEKPQLGATTMVLYRRNRVSGGTYFFTAALADRSSTRLISHIGILRKAFRRVRAERPFDIDAVVILPDHLHAIFTLPERDSDYSGRLRGIKAAFTHGLRKGGLELPSRDKTGYLLWQRRFWEHTIRDDTDFARHVDYIHYNPVKHGYVAHPAEWPHSSLSRFVRNGIVPSDWGAPNQFSEQQFGEREPP